MANNNKKYLILIIPAILIVVSSIFVVVINNQNQFTYSQKSGLQYYANDRLGFSMIIPTSSLSTGSCQVENRDGHKSYYTTPKRFVPIKVFEDSDTVYITNEYRYQTGDGIDYPGNNYYDTTNGNTIHTIKTYYPTCKKVTASLPQLQKEYRENHRSTTGGIIIKVSKATNDLELEEFIKKEYGPTCRLGEKKKEEVMTPWYNTHSLIYNVTVKPDGKDLETSECPMNFAYVLKYDPKNQTVASWHVGQVSNFEDVPGIKNNQIDNIMARSFMFIDKNDR